MRVATVKQELKSVGLDWDGFIEEAVLEHLKRLATEKNEDWPERYAACRLLARYIGDPYKDKLKRYAKASLRYRKQERRELVLGF